MSEKKAIEELELILTEEFNSRGQKRAIKAGINEIRRLEAERDAMREQLDAIDKYLDIGTSDTSIHQNSVMHREVKALLGDEK